MIPLFIRAASALSSLAMSLVLSFLFGAEIFGGFTFLFSLSILLSVFFRCGAEKVLVRWFAAEFVNVAPYPKIVGAFLYMLAWSVLVFIIVLVCLYQFNKEGISIHVIFSAFGLAIVYFIAHVLRSKGAISISLTISGILPQLTIVVVAIVLGDNFGNHISQSILISVCICIAISMLIFNFLVHPIVPVSPALPSRSLIVEGLLGLGHTISVVGVQHLPIVIAGFYFNPLVVAQYQYCVLLSMTIGLLPLVLNAIFEVRFSKAKNDSSNLKREVRSLNIYILKYMSVSVPVAVLIATILLYQEIVYSMQLLFWVVASQIVNVMSSKYQIYEVSVGRLDVAFKSSVAGLLTFLFVVYGVSSLSGGLNEIWIALSVFMSYVSKYFFLRRFSRLKEVY